MLLRCLETVRRMSVKLSARCLLSLIVVFFVGLVQGCGGSKTVAEKIVPASGVIKLDGKPVAGINIRFTPSMRPRASVGHRQLRRTTAASP